MRIFFRIEYSAKHRNYPMKLSEEQQNNQRDKPTARKNGEAAGTWAGPSGCSYRPTGDLNLNHYRFIKTKFA